MKQTSRSQLLVGFALVALMAATRMHHFGSSLHFPDASLAVFLLAGVFIARPSFFALLMLEAGVLDYVAITHLGVSDYCVTPAYWFLIPTYAALWYAGRYYAQIHQFTLRSLGRFSAISFAAVSVAFLISNGAFYLFSGRFPDLSIAEYAGRIAQYYLPYVSGAAMYLVPAALLYAVLARRSDANQMNHA